MHSHRLHDLLIAYNRLLTADPDIAKRNDWPLDQLHLLRRQHSDLGVRLLAVQVLSKQRGWSERKRMEVEAECVGKVDEVDCPVAFGWEWGHDESGKMGHNKKMVDGWLLPLREAQRIENCTSNRLTSSPEIRS